MKRYALLLLLLCSFFTHADFSLSLIDEDGIKQWEKEIFSGETDYELVLLEDKKTLKAVSDSSASGLVLRKKIDLLKTPYINWSWRIARKLPKLDEHTKSGDDYAARIYVVMEAGWLGLKTKALNYVWSSSQDAGQVWNNAYVGSSVKMVSVQGRHSSTNQWYDEKRNVFADMIKYFGDKGSHTANLNAYQYIDVISIMTDTDNSETTAESYYGEIRFSSE
jgi:hypothetical protein